VDIVRQLREPPVLFLASGAFLLPVGVIVYHSDWPPWSSQHTHFAMGNVGEGILAVSALFSVFALVYFVFPLFFRRRMNRALGYLHFWLNAVALLLQFAIPVVFNLTIHSPPNESKWNTFGHRFAAATTSVVLAFLVLAFAQMPFLINLIWSIFKGQKASNLTPSVVNSAVD
jgi:heme/copper-type cytochrome/quinol oxidase subunit 1